MGDSAFVTKPATAPDLIIIRWAPSKERIGNLAILKRGDFGEPTVQLSDPAQPDTLLFLTDLAEMLNLQKEDENEG